MPKNDNQIAVESFQFIPFTGSELYGLIKERTKLGEWIIAEENPEARAKLLDLYDTAVIKMNNVAEISTASVN